jgi:hypothetical protein
MIPLMASATNFLEEVRRYAPLLHSTLTASPLTFTPESESAAAIQVERAIAYPAALLDPKQLSTSIDLLLQAADRPDLPHLASLTVIDRTGHHRPAYRGLLLYAAFQTFRLTYETLPTSDFGKWEEGLRPWADMLESQLTGIDLTRSTHVGFEAFSPELAKDLSNDSDVPRAQILALSGGPATDAAWMALALHVAGKIYIRDAWTDLASDFFGKLTKAQNRSGAFLTTTPSDNPETHGYHELVLLHAAATYAVQTEDRPLAAAVAKSTLFHLNETQPDHATTQPWALFPFLWNPDTRTLADTLLHNASTNASPLTSILLADALYCLRLFGSG